MDVPDSFPCDSVDIVELVMAMEEAFPAGPAIAQIMLIVEQHYPTWSAEQRSKLANAVEEVLRREHVANDDDSDNAIGFLARTLGPKTPRSGGAAQDPEQP
jgi:hypothetical protein